MIDPQPGTTPKDLIARRERRMGCLRWVLVGTVVLVVMVITTLEQPGPKDHPKAPAPPAQVLKHPTPIGPGERGWSPKPPPPPPATTQKPFENDISCGTSTNNTLCKVVEPYAACPTEEGILRFSEILVAERMGFTTAVATAKAMGCIWLHVDDEVYREDLKFFNETIRFRRRGEIQSYWTHQWVFWPKEDG